MINWKKIFELILCLKKKDKRWERIQGKERKQKDFLCFLIYLNSSHYNNFHLFFFIFLGPNTIALDASLGPDEVLSAALEACEVMANIFFFFLLQFPLISLFFIFYFISPYILPIICYTTESPSHSFSTRHSPLYISITILLYISITLLLYISITILGVWSVFLS